MCNTKVCRHCRQEKPIEEFVKDRRSPDGYSTLCKECKRKEDHKYYQKWMQDPEKHEYKLACWRKWKAANKDKCKAAWDEYNKRPEVIERKAQWHQDKVRSRTIE